MRLNHVYTVPQASVICLVLSALGMEKRPVFSSLLSASTTAPIPQLSNTNIAPYPFSGPYPPYPPSSRPEDFNGTQLI